MNDAESRFGAAELALASYANLHVGGTAIGVNPEALQAAGMSFTQATEFAKGYLAVVAVYNDDLGGARTGFQSTIFRDTAGNLTVAIRGTEGTTDVPVGAKVSMSASSSGWASGLRRCVLLRRKAHD